MNWKNSVNDVTSVLGEDGKVSGKAVHLDNTTSESSKVSIGERLVFLASEEAEVQKSDELQDRRSEPESLQIEELGKNSPLIDTRSKRSSVMSGTSIATRVLYLKAKALSRSKKNCKSD